MCSLVLKNNCQHLCHTFCKNFGWKSRVKLKGLKITDKRVRLFTNNLRQYGTFSVCVYPNMCLAPEPDFTLIDGKGNCQITIVTVYCTYINMSGRCKIDGSVGTTFICPDQDNECDMDLSTDYTRSKLDGAKCVYVLETPKGSICLAPGPL